MTIEVTKSFTFDAGHRLGKEYPNKCKFPHGHTYEVFVTAELLGEDLNRYDMSVDFSELKKVKDWCDQMFDHKMVLFEGDPAVEPYKWFLNACGLDVEEGLTTLSANPTAETFAEIIAIGAQDLMPNDVVITRVDVYETPTSCATYFTDWEVID